jgi:hypothetical protein
MEKFIPKPEKKAWYIDIGTFQVEAEDREEAIKVAEAKLKNGEVELVIADAVPVEN